MALNKRLIEIEERKVELITELSGADERRMGEIETETAKLLEEEVEIRKKIDISDKLVSKEEKPDERRYNDSREEVRGKDLKEKRAVTIGSGQLIQPTANQTTINGMLGNGISSIADMVKITPCYNMSEYKVAYITEESTADKITEGTQVPASEEQYNYATIKPVTIATYSEISREAMNLTNIDYYNTVITAAAKALRKKVVEYIIKSDAVLNPSFVGIITASTIDTATDITITSIDDRTLRKIAMSYGGNEDILGNAVLFLNKNDLIVFGDVRGTSEKKAVYEITPDIMNPNTGIIRDGGLTVRYCLNSNLTALEVATAGNYSMIYGIPTCYELGLFSDYTVRTSEDFSFRNRMIAVLGEVMVGGNVTIKNGFVRIKKVAGK